MMRREDWDDDDFLDWADQERIVRQEVKNISKNCLEYRKIKLYGDAIILITYFRLAVLCGISATGKAVFQIVK